MSHSEKQLTTRDRLKASEMRLAAQKALTDYYKSKLDAIEKLAKHLGVYEKDNQQKADPLTALLTRIASGNNNGFVPVAIDPERPSAAKPLSPIEPDDED